MNGSLCELNTTVLPQTMTALGELKEATGLSEGEIIDRVLVRWQAKDPQTAAQLILDAIMIHTYLLTPEELSQSIVEVVTVLKNSLQGIEMDDELIKKEFSNDGSGLDEK